MSDWNVVEISRMPLSHFEAARFEYRERLDALPWWNFVSRGRLIKEWKDNYGGHTAIDVTTDEAVRFGPAKGETL